MDVGASELRELAVLGPWLGLTLAAIWVWRVRVERSNELIWLWNRRRSRIPTGINARCELRHLPYDLERLLVDAQRIRLQLSHIGPVSEELRWAAWVWGAELRRLKHEVRDHLHVPAHSVASTLERIMFEPPPRFVVNGKAVRGWMVQRLLIDRLLWRFLRASLHVGCGAYR